jgi:hypothetical protein
MNEPRKTMHSGWLTALLLGVMTIFAAASQAQTCLTTEDMDAATKAALLNTSQRFFDLGAKGDSATLKQSAIPSLAAGFSGIETVIKDNQANFSAAKATTRPPFFLKAEGTAPIDRAEFLCGVFSANGQTATSSEFVIPNLPPGNYAIAILDVPTAKGPFTVSFVLQQAGTDWKLGGLYVKATQINGHDGNWFADRARQFKTKGQFHNAWFYFLEAREILVPVPFMYTQKTDKLYDESQAAKPSDLPGDGKTSDLAAAGKTYKLTELYPLTVGSDLDMVVKYQSADVSNTTQTYAENMTVIKALLAKYPEFRDAFDGVVVRAVEPSGKDYGAMLSMKDIK